MDSVWLPSLTSVDSLQDAVDAMKDSRRAGVVVQGGGGYQLAYIGSILEAIDRGSTVLAELHTSDAVHIALIDDANRFGIDLVHPLNTQLQYEQLLDFNRTEYSVVAQAHAHALVVTRHEQLERTLNSANTYYCNGPARHYFPYPAVKVGEDCPSCLGRPKGKIHLK